MSSGSNAVNGKYQHGHYILDTENLSNKVYWHIVSSSDTITAMIKSFRHKGIEKFFLTGKTTGIRAAHASKLRRQLVALNEATGAKAMDIPGWKLHALKGHFAGHWSVWVSANWRLTFAFDGPDAILVDYQDYH